jgi:hypothetical protein
MHRTWTWKIFSIATEFRGGAKEKLRLLQSIKDFHGPPCSPATCEQHTTTTSSTTTTVGAGLTAPRGRELLYFVQYSWFQVVWR